MPRQDESLEIGQILDFQQKEWRVQPVIWLLGALLLGAALLGLFGNGPVSRQVAASNAVAVEYERFVRKRAPTDLTMQIQPNALAGDEVAVWVDRAYFASIDIERVLPEPVAMATAGDRVIYRFAVPQGDVQAPAEITFSLEPDKSGFARGRIGIVSGNEVAFDQFVYP
jgi:hypothetical protein